MIKFDRLPDTKNLLSVINENESVRLALCADEFSINDIFEKREKETEINSDSSKEKISCYTFLQERQTHFRKAAYLPTNSR